MRVLVLFGFIISLVGCGNSFAPLPEELMGQELSTSQYALKGGSKHNDVSGIIADLQAAIDALAVAQTEEDFEAVVELLKTAKIDINIITNNGGTEDPKKLLVGLLNEAISDLQSIADNPSNTRELQIIIDAIELLITHLSGDPAATCEVGMSEASFLEENFEKKLGAVNPDYVWYTTPGTIMEVTKDVAFEGKQSLRVVTPGDVTSDWDAVGVQFCVPCEAHSHFKASFAVRFENFVSWNGIMVTNSPHLAYWWWVRGDGSIFDNVTFDTFQPGTWSQVEIEINRATNIASIAINGAVHEAPLDTWYPGAADQPMGCLRLWNISETAQTFYVDNIKVAALQ